MPLPDRPADRPPLKQVWHYTLETITPLHIGAGGTPLQKDTDFIVTSRDVAVLDAERTFERIYERSLRPTAAPAVAAPVAPSNSIAQQLAKLGLGSDVADALDEPAGPSERDVLDRLARGMTPNEAVEAGWLIAADLSGPASIVRYRLQPPSGVGAPLPDLQPPQILPLIKNARQQPYLPGSSLKGALRTALAAQLFSAADQPLQLNDVLGRGYANPKAADDRIESRLLGRDPNHDLLRALLVGDSAALPTSPALAVAGTYTIRNDGSLQFKPGFYVALEVFPPGTQLQGQIRLDRYLFAPEPQKQLGFGPTADWLADFPALCNAHARRLISSETAFYRQHGLPQVAGFYERLLHRLDGLPPGACLLQLSWGTGWLAKTLGPLLTAQPAFAAVRAQFGAGMNRRPTAVFPKTRRLTLGGPNYAQAGEPLGWVELRLV
ncbi:MAG: type III-A CRISPR-associated RAMP protein Csm5 [Chloroflexota bacterium]|nr:type III-A CRISPR-associated RAMP protein Csm5 [Chloroflexota bacterium]